MPVVSIVGGYLLYVFGLLSGYNPLLWWIAYLCWSVFLLYNNIRSRSSAFRTWILLFLTLPKRDPNIDFSSALNFTQGGELMLFPLYELILFSASVATLLGPGRIKDDGGPSNLLQFRRLLRWFGQGLLLYAVMGAVFIFYNSMYQDIYFYGNIKAYAVSRTLRMASEGLVIIWISRISWMDFARQIAIRRIAVFATSLGVLELLLWLFPVMPAQIGRYLYDFRGGFRPLVFGISSGAALAVCWMFLVCVFILQKNKIWLTLSALCGILATLNSYHRTQFGALAAGLLFIIIAIKSSEVRFLRFVIIIALAALGSFLFSEGRRYLEEISFKKGSEYLSLDSIESRFDLAAISADALVHAPFPLAGIGVSALSSYFAKMVDDGVIAASSFADTLSATGDVGAFSSGNRIFDSHNLFVSMITESGLVGFICVVLYFSLGLFYVKRCRGRTRIAVSMWLVILVAGLTQAEPYLFSPMVIVGALIWPEMVSIGIVERPLAISSLRRPKLARRIVNK